jgi:hypothetical protein
MQKINPCLIRLSRGLHSHDRHRQREGVYQNAEGDTNPAQPKDDFQFLILLRFFMIASGPDFLWEDDPVCPRQIGHPLAGV